MKRERPLFLYTTLFVAFLIVLSACKKDKDETVTDGDGNEYTSVTIGDQVWLVGNLMTTSLNDGTAIPLIVDGADWCAATGSGYCFCDNNISNKDVYGALYNWFAVNTGKLCPTGWHVATQNDWDDLVDFLGGEAVAGGKLKTTGTIESGDGLWHQPNVDATNEFGLSMVPGGQRSGSSGLFFDFGDGGLWWSSTEFEANNANMIYINNFNGAFGKVVVPKKDGYSVRCVKN
jgi:uncharacterized protein (TIGR02145 family)